MKPILPALLVMLPVMAASGAPDKYPMKFRDAATHEQLAARLQRAEQADPMKLMTESTGVDPSKVNQPVNLLEQSDILCFGGLATLVPKRAILSAPSALSSRLSLEAGTRIVGWPEFYRLNRGWITTVEVSRTQAEGRKAIAEPTQERISKSRNLVVATYKGGPISVLELREPETEEKES